MNKNNHLRDVIKGMRKAYFEGQNAMKWFREHCGQLSPDDSQNTSLSILMAYDLQAGSYIEYARQKPNETELWGKQLLKTLDKYVSEGDSLLEVGVGEATTLCEVLKQIKRKPSLVAGFDISWSRIWEGKKWLEENSQDAALFVADLFSIPLETNSIDIVYTSHSLEPNGGREEAALCECIRVARKYVILFEPIYELASDEARKRMLYHGYVKNLKKTAESFGVKIIEYKLLEHSINPLNPSGVIVIKKEDTILEESRVFKSQSSLPYICPLTGENILEKDAYVYCPTMGTCYPKLKGVPLLNGDNVIIASKLKN